MCEYLSEGKEFNHLQKRNIYKMKIICYLNMKLKSVGGG